jgi:uncharacterized protein (TIGR01244 family)
MNATFQSRYTSRHYVGCALVLVVAAIAACQTQDSAHVKIEGIRNQVQIGDLLFGGQPSEEALAQLAAQGYKTVLSARTEPELRWDEKAKVESLGMTFVRIPMENPVTKITDEQVNNFAGLMENGERPMVLHCGSGNRVAGLWAVWLVEHKNVEPTEALRQAEEAGMTSIRNVVGKRLGLTR